jgi:hypothetical protein
LHDPEKEHVICGAGTGQYGVCGAENGQYTVCGSGNRHLKQLSRHLLHCLSERVRVCHELF